MGGNPDSVLTGGQKAHVGVQSGGRPNRSWRFPCRGGAAAVGECGQGGLPSGSYKHRTKGDAKPVTLSLNSGSSLRVSMHRSKRGWSCGCLHAPISFVH